MKIASSVAVFAFFVIACTTTTTTTTSAPQDAGTTVTDGTEGEKTNTGTAATPGADAGKDAGKGKDSGSDEPTCADTAKQLACGQCCAADHQEGAIVYQTAVSECMCDEANCATDCESTLCAAQPKNPDATCNTCFNAKQNACAQPVTDACSANADCVAFYQCLTSSGCANKPQ
ncbi:MAG TPA: hypothetical protein VM925_33570 [Labilithrix sp.]|nr:hypothetical protein [Labilithrix sp.]